MWEHHTDGECTPSNVSSAAATAAPTANPTPSKPILPPHQARLHDTNAHKMSQSSQYARTHHTTEGESLFLEEEGETVERRAPPKIRQKRGSRPNSRTKPSLLHSSKENMTPEKPIRLHQRSSPTPREGQGLARQARESLVRRSGNMDTPEVSSRHR